MTGRKEIQQDIQRRTYGPSMKKPRPGDLEDSEHGVRKTKSTPSSRYLQKRLHALRVEDTEYLVNSILPSENRKKPTEPGLLRAGNGQG